MGAEEEEAAGTAATGATGGPPGATPPHETALVFLPRGRDRIRMTLAMVASVLPAGSPLWVVGAKGDGIESAGRELEQVAVPQGVETGKHARLLMSRTLPPRAARLEDDLEVWPLSLGGETLQVVSLPGVFSHGRLDDGTRLLLETLPSLPGPLLDVGCGAGILGAWYAVRGAGPVTLVDADALAVEAARRTLALNGLSGRVEAGDVFPPETAAFASIISNPPFHQGSATDDRVTATLVAGAGARLRPGGTLTLVCNRFLPIPDRLDRAFGSHVALADDARYRVYQVTRR
jgi:16S rRNA (guanine1207-N2)-methyltransferase